MAQIPGTTFSIELAPGERILSTFQPSGLGAQHIHGVSKPLVVLTNQQYHVLEIRGTFTKRAASIASFRWREMTPRINRNEGTAFGPFLYCLALFPKAEEYLMAGFKTERQREDFAECVEVAIETALAE